MSPTASTGSRTLYNLTGTMSLFLLIRLWKPFVSCGTTTRMPRWSSFSGEHSIIGDYAKAIKADGNIVDIRFGAMTIRYKYKSSQAWMTNNCESYLIIWFGSPNEVVFHQSPQLPSFLSFASKPPVSLKSGDHPVNYAVKPVDAMRCFIKMFSNPGDTVIDAFAGTHTTSIAAFS